MEQEFYMMKYIFFVYIEISFNENEDHQRYEKREYGFIYIFTQIHFSNLTKPFFLSPSSFPISCLEEGIEKSIFVFLPRPVVPIFLLRLNI